MNIPKVYIHSIFDSVQGEGHLSGHYTKFIRFSGCTVGCHWCDSRNTWKQNKIEPINVLDLVKDIAKTIKPNMWVCITGGEPLEQYRSLKWMVEKFETISVNNISIETCGVPIDDVKQIIDLYNCKLFFSISPKLPSALRKRYDQSMFENIVTTWRDTIPVHFRVQFKFVVSSEDDLECLAKAYDNIGGCGDCHLFLQIEASKVTDKKFINNAIKFIKQNTKFRLCIQQHIVLGLE